MRFVISSCILFSLVVCSGCQKVIHIDLNDAEKKYVVEGVVTNQPGTSMVLLSQTKNFEDDNSFAGVSGATISIAEDGGPTTLLTETSTGVYEAPALTGTSGKTYRLTVQINGQTITAVSTMPQPVNMDSIFITNDDIRGKNRKLANVQFKDPLEPGNNYRFVEYVNGIKQDNIYIRNDELINGNTVVSKLRNRGDDDTESDKNIKAGDMIKVDMLCIDPAVYKYWYSLNRSATGNGNGMAATPANPVSNLQGDALGYFSAHTLQSRTTMAQ